MSLYKKLTAIQIVKRLVRDYVSCYKKQVFVAILFMIIVALCSVSIVALVKPAIDKVLISHDHKMMIILPLIMFGVYVLKGITEFFQNYIVKYVGQQILTNIQMQMYKHLLVSDFLFIQSKSSGRLISRFTNDIMLLRNAFSTILVGFAKHMLSVLFLIILMFNFDPYLSIFIFLVFPIAVLPIQKLGKRMRSITDEAQEELSNFTSKLDETFDAIKITKSFCAEDVESKKAIKITRKIVHFYKRTAKLDSLASPIMEILSGLVIACVLWYGGYSIIKGEMTAGTLFGFITAFISAYRPFKSLVSLNVNLQEGLAAANRVFNILDLEPTITDCQNAMEPDMHRSQIKFHNLSMRFDKKEALSLLNLTIEANKTYAFVGRSGSGKTTIVNLLIRLFDPTDGEIAINDIDIKNISLKHLRQNIAIVTQDVVLFDTSIAENIAYGMKDASRDDVIKAAKAADADEFIVALSQGYDTIVGASAFTLSGGQRQRLSIARAFLKNAPVLLLDEATSSLDPNSEQSIIRTIKKLRKNRTTLIITHRLNSIVNADQIIVMKKGAIIERGTHQELLKNKNEYCKLYNQELQEIVNSV